MSPRGTAVTDDRVSDGAEGRSVPAPEDGPARTRRRPTKAKVSLPAAQSTVIIFDDLDEDDRPAPGDPEVDALPVDAPPPVAPAPAGAASPGAGVWVRSHRAVLATGVVAVALAVALILTLSALGNQHAVSGARTGALAAARTDAVELAGYNYRHLNADFALVTSHSTPTFRRNFAQAGEALKGTLARYHAVAEAKVVSAGVVSATTSRAVILVFLTQTIKNSTQSATTTDRSQVEITLVSSQGTWLINNVSLL
jgi:Mce-associated membrane protein